MHLTSFQLHAIESIGLLSIQLESINVCFFFGNKTISCQMLIKEKQKITSKWKKNWKNFINFSQSLIKAANTSKRNEITKQKQIETKKKKRKNFARICIYFKQGSCTNYTSVKMPILIATYSKSKCMRINIRAYSHGHTYLRKKDDNHTKDELQPAR